jgi:hypothetical protein
MLVTSKEDTQKLGINLLRKTPALTGVFLLSVLAEQFPSVSTCHSLSDDFVSKKETKVSEEVPHNTKVKK